MPRFIAFVTRNTERLGRRFAAHNVTRRPKRGRYRLAT
jgi:hypothetical protein